MATGVKRVFVKRAATSPQVAPPAPVPVPPEASPAAPAPAPRASAPVASASPPPTEIREFGDESGWQVWQDSVISADADPSLLQPPVPGNEAPPADALPFDPFTAVGKNSA